MLERLLSNAPAPALTPRPHSHILKPCCSVCSRECRRQPRSRVQSIVCFFLWQAGPRGGQVDEIFPYMLLGWSAEKVGTNYVMILSHVAAERQQSAADPGRGGQPPRSVMNSDPRTPVVVHVSPLPGLRRLYGLYPRRILMTTG